MTPTQAENREHKLAYMTQDSDVTEEDAHAWMDTRPSEYGIRDRVETQGELYESRSR